MRFGHDFHRYQVPEWAPSYIPYLLLKSMFNTAVRLARCEESQPDFTGELRTIPDYLLCQSPVHSQNFSRDAPTPGTWH
jgi:hypothetical protein